MLRSLLRASRVCRQAMRQKDQDKPLHPLLLKIRSKIEWYADYLEHGDPPKEEDFAPAIFESNVQELEAVKKAVPETYEEYLYLEERRETIIGEIERSRLDYFDGLLGTNTFYQEVDRFQERIGIDMILERRLLKYDKPQKINPKDVMVIGPTNRRINKGFLSEREDKETVQATNFRDKLYLYNSRVYDATGKPHTDPYSYLSPERTLEKDQGMILSYIDTENKRFYANLSQGDSVLQRMRDDMETWVQNVKTAELFPQFTKTHVYCFSQVGKCCFRFPIGQYLAGKVMKFEEDMFDLLGVTQLVKDLGEDVTRQKLEAIGARFTPKVVKPKTEAGALFEVVFMYDDLTEYFFNFQDRESYALNRHLMWNPITVSQLCYSNFDPSGRYMVLTVAVAECFVTLVLDTATGKYFNRYFVARNLVNFASNILADPKTNQPYIYLYVESASKQAADQGEESSVVDFVRLPLFENSFVAYKARSEEIPSLLKYMQDNQASLFDNSDVSYEVIMQHDRSNIHKWSSPRHVGSDLLIDSPASIDGLPVGGPLRVKPDGSLEPEVGLPAGAIVGLTERYEWAVVVGPSREDARLMRRDLAEPKSGWTKMILKEYQIAGVHFAERGIVLVLRLPNKERDDLFCRIS